MPTLLPIVFAALAWADPPAASEGSSAVQIVAAVETVLGDVIERAENSVVAIAREKTENDDTQAVRGRDPIRSNSPDRRFGNFGNIDPFGPDEMSFDFGSGVVIGEKGEILTAFHVVRGARVLHVRAANRQTFDAEIIAADPRSDLAVLVPREVPGLAPPILKPVPLGDSSKLRKGSFLVALGNPFNAARDGRPSASWGILSNIARKLEPSNDELQRQELSLRHYPTLLQLDSKLNQGMSGGAVLNMRGEIIGLTTAAASAAGFDAQAGYAIPIDGLARKVIEALRQGKEYEYGFLGIRLDVQNKTSRVLSADPGSPAADGGVQVDDLILAVSGTPVADMESLVVAINSIPAGESAELKLLRRNQTIERSVQLAKLKLKSPVIVTNRPAPWRGIRVDYTSTLAGAAFAPDLAEAMARRGVVITEVEPGSEASRAGLKVGQLVIRADGQSVPNPREFSKVVADLNGPVKIETDQGPVTLK